jgi:hypothetical protein
MTVDLNRKWINRKNFQKDAGDISHHFFTSQQRAASYSQKKETTMVEKTVRTVENVRLGFIEQLLDVEELESKQAPSDQVMLPGGCHNHNETLLRKD